MKRTTITKRPPAQGLLAGTLFILLLLAASCTEADVTRNDNPGQQIEEVETTFDLKVAPSTTPMTRSITLTDKGATEVDTLAVGATASVTDTLQTRSATELPDAQEEKVANLWIGQYNAAGTTLLSHQYIEAVTGTQVTVRLKAAVNCHVRFVANAGDIGSIATETLLDAKTLAYASTADGRPQSNLFAMTGTWTGDITKETTSLPLPTEAPAVMLTRLAAKITFTYKINGEGFTFTPTAVSLKNVPNCSQIGTLSPGNQPAGATYTTLYTGTVSNTGATIYWYLPENMAGTGTPSVNSEKEKTGRGVNNATYIELFGNAVQNGVEYKNVAFRFYPGKDENDYNIKRNDHFIMKLDLKGLDISDKRITVGEIPPITESSTGNLPAVGGSKEVHITSRAGAIWSLPLPVWLSATMNGQITPGGSTLTNQGAGKVTFTADMNQTASVRNQRYDIKLDDTRSQSFTIAQDASTLAISGATSVSIGAEASTRSFAFTATPGLNWTAGANVGWISLTGASSGTTPSGTVSVPYSVPLNPTTSVRSGNITVRAGDPSNGPSGTLNITQAPIVFNLSANVLNLNCLEVTNSSITLTGTPGLAWTVTPSTETNGITPQTTVGTADGSPQAIPFHATENTGVATRTATFTVSSPASPSLTKTITVNQESIAVTINQAMLRNYVKAVPNSDLPNYRPFDMDGDGGSTIINKHGISFDLNAVPPTITGSYTIQVQSTQPPDTYIYQSGSDWPARNYCNSLTVDGHDDWRLPTQIELYAMWNKAKGNNDDATDNEPDSKVFGAPFLSNWYWGSSVGSDNASIRCKLNFNGGGFTNGYTNGNHYVRCVRDL